MAYPHTQKARADENYITVFHNGRLTLKRKEEPPPKTTPTIEEKGKEAAPKEKLKDPSAPVSSSPAEGPSSSGAPLHHRSSSKEPMERHPPHRSSSKERRPSHPGPSIPIPIIPPQPPRNIMGLDPWGRPIMLPPGADAHKLNFPPLNYPPPGYYGGFPRPVEKSRESRDRGGSPRRGSSPRKRTPPPPGLDLPRDSKRPRSRTPERIVTIKKEVSPVKGRHGSRSPRRISASRRSPGKRSPGRRSPGRRSPRRSPKRSPSRRSPRKSPSRNPVSKRSPRKSPSRKSPSRKSPGRRSPGKRSSSHRRSPPPRRRSPSRKSPGRRVRSPPRKPTEKQEDGDGTVFLDEGAYAELLSSLG